MPTLNIQPAVLEYIQAPDAVEQLASRLHGTVLLVGGKTALFLTLPRLTHRAAFRYDVYEVTTYPCQPEIDSAMQKAADIRADAIVGIGGGRAIDTGKTAAAKLHLPFYTLPTEVGTCAPAARLYVCYRPDGSRGLRDNEWVMDEPIQGCFVDTTILKDSPKRYLAAGIADNFAKLCEPYSAEYLDRNHTPQWKQCIAVGAEMIDSFYSCSDAAMRGDDDALDAMYYANFYLSGALLTMLGNTRPNMVLAHAVYDGACDVIPGERDAYLHGEYVAVGVLHLLRLMTVKEIPYEKTLRLFRDVLHVPTTLEEVLIHTPERKEALLQNMVARRAVPSHMADHYRVLFGLE